MRVNLLKSLIRLLVEASLGGIGIYLRPLESKALSLSVRAIFDRFFYVSIIIWCVLNLMGFAF